MTTETLTLPRRALVETDDTQPSPLRDPQEPTARPRRSAKRRPSLIAQFRRLIADDRPADAGPLLLIGPNSGPIWTVRLDSPTAPRD